MKEITFTYLKKGKIKLKTLSINEIIIYIIV